MNDPEVNEKPALELPTNIKRTAWALVAVGVVAGLVGVIIHSDVLLISGLLLLVVGLSYRNGALDLLDAINKKVNPPQA